MEEAKCQKYLRILCVLGIILNSIAAVLYAFDVMLLFLANNIKQQA